MINLNLILILFAVAAVTGLLSLVKVLKNENTSKPIVFAHGGLAAVALVLLLVYYLDNPAGLMVPLVLFVVAALGGFFLFYKDMSNQKIPVPVAIIHAGAAIAAFVLLLLAAL